MTKVVKCTSKEKAAVNYIDMADSFVLVSFHCEGDIINIHKWRFLGMYRNYDRFVCIYIRFLLKGFSLLTILIVFEFVEIDTFKTSRRPIAMR